MDEDERYAIMSCSEVGDHGNPWESCDINPLGLVDTKPYCKSACLAGLGLASL